MATQTEDKAVQFTKKSGKGLRQGVVSELTTFFGDKRGHTEELPAALER